MGRRRPNAGFSYTELLMVTSIVMTAAAKGGGVYGGAMNKTHEVNCASQMKQIGMALQMFALDQGGFPSAKFFPENPDTDEKGLKVLLKPYLGEAKCGFVRRRPRRFERPA